MILADRGTPEQPSPRTAQSQDTFSPLQRKSHVRANRWHQLGSCPLFGQISRSEQLKWLRA